MDAYNAILKTDPSAYRVVNNAINANALAMWDPPASAQTNQLHDTLNGMKDTDLARFSNLNLMSYYGGMPVAQLNSLIDAQDRIRKNDAAEAAKHTDLISSISAVKDLTIRAAASAESPFYKMDRTSPSPPEQQKWNEFVSKYGQALDDWQQNNNGKIPTDMQKREIAPGILFPHVAPGRQTSTEIHDLTNKQRLDDAGKAYAPDDQSAPDQPAAQKKKPEDSWFWQTMESSGTLKPYAERMREYVESPTDTKGAWDWLTSTVPKSGAQLSVGLARTPFDLAQTFSSGSQAAIEKFLKEHPEYEELAREDPTGQSLETLGAIGAGAGLLDAVEATAKGAAASIGKPLGIDTGKQTWSWENFKDAWVNHPVESLVAVIPFGAAFLKRKGITPSESQVRELVDSAVKDEKTPLAQELKNEMEQGPLKEELDFSEDSGDSSKRGATFGQATTKDYPSTFYAENPELEGDVEVHHAVEQQTLKRYPGIVSEAEMHSIENLRGIPKEISSDLHQSQIRREWNLFYKLNRNASKQELLEKATEIDSKYGSQFKPPRGGD